MPSFQLPDRYLYLAFGLSLLAAYHAIGYALTDLIELNATREPTGIEETGDDCAQDVQKPEDLISLTSLRVLAECHNLDIANAAKSLITTRFLSLPIQIRNGLLLSDRLSQDPEIRQRSNWALRFLHEWDDGSLATVSMGSLRGRVDPWAERIGASQPWDGDGDDVDNDEIDASPEQVPRLRPIRRETWDVEDVIRETRRRRREAIVVHDGEGEVSESDIIRPR